MSTSSTDNIFLRYPAGLTSTVAGLLVLFQFGRAWALSRPPVEAGQAFGCAELGMAYLLILPAIWRGTRGIVAIMFTYVGLFGVTQLLAPDNAGLLGAFAVGTQAILAIFIILNHRKQAAY